jgi:hypothetical protein
MIFAPPFHRVVEHVDRRVLGAFQCVDAVTELPVFVAARVEVTGAALVEAGDSVEVPFLEGSVRIQQNRSGSYAILQAPFFDDYSASFDDPSDPAETPPGTRLRLRVSLQNVGPNYLPQEFEFDLPRPLDRATGDSVFQPAAVELFRSPGASVLGGWSVVRAQVSAAGTREALPGVLVRVFRSPRGDGDQAIGWGISEWRGDLCGEALVAIADLQRFRPGAGANVFETTQPVEFEVARDPGFTGSWDELPNAMRIIAGTTPGIIRQRSDLPDPPLIADPPTPLMLRAGRELTVRLTMS